MGSFKELVVWQKSHAFTLSVYEVTKKLPKEQQFGLTSQIRRAAVSIPSNIVEGYERGSMKEFQGFLLIARGSNAEVQEQLLLAYELGFIDKKDFDNLSQQSVEVNKQINGFRKGLARELTYSSLAD